MRLYPSNTPLSEIPPHFRGVPYEQYMTEQLLKNFEQDKPAYLANRNTDPARIPFGNARSNYGIRGHVSSKQSSLLPTNI